MTYAARTTTTMNPPLRPGVGAEVEVGVGVEVEGLSVVEYVVCSCSVVGIIMLGSGQAYLEVRVKYWKQLQEDNCNQPQLLNSRISHIFNVNQRKKDGKKHLHKIGLIIFMMQCNAYLQEYRGIHT